MAFRIAPWAWANSARLRISVCTSTRSPDFSAPMLMTMSRSWAPFWAAASASASLVTLRLAPSGKPITVPTFTGDPWTCAAASVTYAGFTMTQQNP